MDGNRHIAAVAYAPSASERYAFGDFELDIPTSVVCRNGLPLKLNARSMDVLVYLLRNRDRLVSTSELMQAVWPDVRVNSGSLRQAIWEVRRTLRQPGRAEIVETVWGKGYRFAAAVERCCAGGAAKQLNPSEAAGIRQSNALSARRLEDVLASVPSFRSAIETQGTRSPSPALDRWARAISEEDLFTLLEFLCRVASRRGSAPMERELVE